MPRVYTEGFAELPLFFLQQLFEMDRGDARIFALEVEGLEPGGFRLRVPRRSLAQVPEGRFPLAKLEADPGASHGIAPRPEALVRPVRLLHRQEHLAHGPLPP